MLYCWSGHYEQARVGGLNSTEQQPTQKRKSIFPPDSVSLMRIHCNFKFGKTTAGLKYSPIYAFPSTIIYTETTAKD